MAYARDLKPSPQEIKRAVGFFIREECWIEAERWVESQRLGLRGRIDAVAVCPGEAVPIEIKLRSSPVAVKRFALHHIAQIVAYSIAAEETLKLPVYRALVVSIEPETVFELRITPALREYTYRLSRELRRVIDSEGLPRPTSFRSRCRVCFYRRFCPV